ncbi:MAG: penicillin-binding protein 1C [Hirschia sp.]|nr:penicillin-binding protein 1C [Hirschia sp.]MBF18397.1 penicillin-binding protein 1C [Hirschia sp.]MBF18712.1 penicillin-binding protein 1C [Hirschia sp.]
MRRGWGRRMKRLGVVLAGLVLLVAALDLLFPPPLEKAREISRVVLDRQGAPLRAYPLTDGRWRMRADLDRIDPVFVEALLAYEDKRFYAHWGVDAAAMSRSMLDLVKAGRIVSGGSTITMQTARLLEPKERTLGAKLQQMIRAVQLERRMSKREILELYLTLAPYGGNLEGVRAASWAWFGREPRDLTPDQIALLIALPQSPEVRRPDLRPDNARAARARVLDRLVWRGLVAADHAEESKTAPIPTRNAFPALAWQAADEVLSGAPEDAADVDSTIDIALQSAFEELALARSDALEDDAQIAILAVDIDDRSVRAAVGSASRQKAGGWLDLTDRARSPGSTLKPFIYGLAFDDGIAAPATRISDLPKRFANYQPENFDRTFRGDVTVSEALQHSLNVPAVQALEAVGPKRFAAALTFAGAPPRLPKDAETDPGLALALGGAGMTVRDIATIYAALGDNGQAAPLRWRQNDPQPEPVARLMSTASSQRILEILRTAPSPAGRMPASLTQDAPQIAFKTGTSYGYRDAWAAGVSRGRAIVVWVGRADGAPRLDATGRKAALPILFEAFDLADRILGDAGGHNDVHPDMNDMKAFSPLAQFGSESVAPQILFPPDGAEIWADSPDRSFVLAARGRGELTWYADGHRLARNASGEPVWSPRHPGFYKISVVDAQGRQSRANIRLLHEID